MKRAPGIILLACISVWLYSCDKFSVGELTTDDSKSVDQPFQVVEFRDDVNATLLHADPTHPAGTIIITTGANLIDNINTEICEFIDINDTYGDTITFNKLIIKNENTLNYLHSYNYNIEATIYYDTLYQLIFHSNARHISTDTLKGYNYMTQFSQDTVLWDSLAPRLLLDVEGGSGNFDIITDCYRVVTKHIHGTADITLKGKTSIASTYADFDCHGIIDSKDLYSHIHYVNSSSTNKVIVKAYYLLSAKNDNVGQIEYVDFKTQLTTIHGDTIIRSPQIKDFRGIYKNNIIPYKD